MEETEMNVVDLKNAFEGGTADNFTVLLLRLIAKADSKNREKFCMGFPVEAMAVKIYTGSNCPYKNSKSVPSCNGFGTVVDYEKICEMASQYFVIGM